jgi:hypothetical protein
MRRPRRSLRCCVCLIAAALLADAAGTLAGPVRYLSQDRFVSGELDEEYHVIGDPPVRFRDSDFARAPDFTDFDGSIDVEVVPPPDQLVPHGSGRVTATQRSTLSDAGMSAAGFLSGFVATSNGEYVAESEFVVTFELDAPLTYDLSFSVARQPDAGGQTRVLLQSLDGVTTLFEEDLDFGAGSPVTGGRAGTLAPGSYRFGFTHHVGPGIEASGDYAVDLALTADGPDPTPIFLPPAALPGLATLGGIVALRVRRRA